MAPPSAGKSAAAGSAAQHSAELTAAERAQQAMLGAVDFNQDAFSCKRVFAHAGTLMAVPHECPLIKILPLKQNNQSVQHRDYSAKASTSCGANSKPLEPYNPNAQRSRLAQSIPKRGGRNASQIVFGDNNPRQFVTSHQNMHRGFGGIQSTNNSVVAQKTRWFHHLQNL